MILAIFTLMLIITFFLLIIGYWLEAAEIKFIAWAFLFVISMSFVTSGVDYPSGNTITGTTGNYTVTYSYANYTNHWIAVFLGIMATVMFISVFFEIRRARAP